MSSPKYQIRRLLAVLTVLAGAAGWIIVNPGSYETETVPDDSAADVAPLGVSSSEGGTLAIDLLETLEVKGRAPKTGYARTEFYSTWPNVDGCNLRQKIIRREVGESAVMDGCDVIAGTFTEPYTGKTFTATKKSDFSNGIQIDHVVALSDAWQKGAQYKTAEERYALATDPLNLLAVDAAANQQKSDGDAATWLPANKSFRCQYIARQISVKSKYGLWVTQAEHDAMLQILNTCPGEKSLI